MPIPIAYLAVVLIWSTTPLAVKWSERGAGYLLGAFARIGIAALFCVLLMLVLRMQWSWDRGARRAYAAASIATYGAMLCIYWSVQFIPSGLIAVLFGLTPFVTALLAYWLLDERSLTRSKIGGMALGLVGLAVIFGAGLALGPRAGEGIAVVLFGIVINALSMVLVKRESARLSPMALTTGALVLAALLFLVTWWLLDGRVPASLPSQTIWSMLYLGLIASVLGFTLFYYLLKHTTASGVALLTLVSPVAALLLGSYVDHERITPSIWAGTALVLSGLGLHQWGHRLPRLGGFLPSGG